MFAFLQQVKPDIPSAADALPGRATPMPVSEPHFVNGHPLTPPYPDCMDKVMFGLGCFWGAERIFWQIEGVHVTAAGYAAGHTPNPTYEEVCSGATGHTEVVLVTYDKTIVTLNEIIKVFWEIHDPTQGYRQGNDMGTQYRSAIYFTTREHETILTSSKKSFQATLSAAGKGSITTEIKPMEDFYFAEDYHQQYLVKNPNGYCALRGTGCEYVY